jgi:hypothetical protein
MTWARAENKWRGFLAQVEKTQYELNCTWSNAWFRGVEDASFCLKPSLLRLEWRDIPTVERSEPALINLNPQYREVSLQRQQIRKKMEGLYAASKKAELDLAAIEYEKLKGEEKRLRAEANRERDFRLLLRLGERDAFINYQFRSGITAENSWQMLAEMQHNGVPTRLLDWTDILVSALYFALKLFRPRLEKFWFDERRKHPKKSTPIVFPPPGLTRKLPTPALWILNPYYLARHSSERDRIWDLTLDPHLDYYKCFIEDKKWPFRYPIPIYSPWKTQRIAAQRGMFLVWGYDRRALEEMLDFESKGDSRIARRLVIDKQAAIYAVKHIRQLFTLDRFAMFRDLDALGTKVRREFLHDLGDREEIFD